MKKEELQEIQCLRAVLERILRVMDEGLFVDYQMEKFGRIKYKQTKISPELLQAYDIYRKELGKDAFQLHQNEEDKP